MMPSLAAAPLAWGGLFALALLTLLTTAALGLMTSLTTQALRAGFRPPGNPLLSPADLLVRLALILLLGGAAWWAGIPATTLGWNLEGWMLQTFAGAAIGVALALLLRQLNLPPNEEGDADPSGAVGLQPAELVQMIVPHSRREAILVLLALLPAALLEELLFRSLWIGAGALLAPAWAMLLISALLFGLMHAAQGRVGVVATVCAGLLFGVLFLWAGSLVLPLIAHYAANAVQILLAARDSQAKGHSPRPEPPF